MNTLQNLRVIVVLLLVGFSILIAADSSSEENEGHGEQCLGQAVNTTAKKAANDSCITELKLDGKKDKKFLKNECFRFCRLKKLGIIGANNSSLDIAKTGKFVDSAYPEAARKGIKDGITACGTTPLGSSSSDDDCKKYKALIKCIDTAVKKSCKKENKVASTSASGSPASASASASGRTASASGTPASASGTPASAPSATTIGSGTTSTTRRPA